MTLNTRVQTSSERIGPMKKKEILRHWQGITPGANLKPDAVAYKHEGSTYDQDGIRITGTQEWIDSVLSRLSDLLKYENGSTRLQIVYKQSTDRMTGAQMDSYNCYVQVHERGGQAQQMNAMVEGVYARSGKKLDYVNQL